MDEIVSFKKQSLRCILKKASEYILLKKKEKAIITFEKAKKIYYDDPDKEEYDLGKFDMCVIDYALVKCYTTNKKHYEKRRNILTTLGKRGHTFPPLSYQLALLLFGERRYNEAERVINETLAVISNVFDHNDLKVFWPCSNTEIPESSPAVLKEMFFSLKQQCQSELEKLRDLSDDGSYQSDSSSDEPNFFKMTEAAYKELKSSSSSSINKELPTREERESLLPTAKSYLKLDAPEFIPLSYRKNSPNSDFNTKCEQRDNMSSDNYLKKYEDKSWATKVDTNEHENGIKNSVMLLLKDQIMESIKQFQLKSSEKEETINRNVDTILSQLTENQELRSKVKNLEIDLENQKDYSLELERHYAEEDKLKSVRCAKLEVHIEELQKVLEKNENLIKKQQQKNKILETSLTEQFSRFCSSQKQEVIRQINKCGNMITDLNMALPFLTSTSAPTVEECRASISRWEDQLKTIKQHSETLDEYFQTVFNQICNEEYPLQLNLPGSHADISELRDVLHDNYIPTVIYLIKSQKPNVLNPPQPMPNPAIWYGKCVPQPGAVVPKPYFFNTFNAPPFYTQPSIQSATVPLKTPTKSDNFLTEVSSRVIEPDHTKTSKIIEMTAFEETEAPLEDYEKTEELPCSVSEEPETILSSTVYSEEPNLETAVLNSAQVNEVAITDVQDIIQTPENTTTVTASCSYLDKESELINLNDFVRNKDSQHVSNAAKAIGGPKFFNLFLHVKKKIPSVAEELLLNALKNVRQKKVKLSGMTREDIVKAVLDELNPTSDSQDVNKPAWGSLKTDYINWKKDVSDDVCVICYDQYDVGSVTELKCKHSFHSSCVRTWFRTNSICPICRLHTTTDEDFPPLV